MSLTGEKVGKISKQWSGMAREIFTDADFFGITFPLDLDVRMKAVLLGATFLIVSIVLTVISLAFVIGQLINSLQSRFCWYRGKRNPENLSPTFSDYASTLPINYLLFSKYLNTKTFFSFRMPCSSRRPAIVREIVPECSSLYGPAVKPLIISFS